MQKMQNRAKFRALHSIKKKIKYEAKYNFDASSKNTPD